MSKSLSDKPVDSTAPIKVEPLALSPREAAKALSIGRTSLYSLIAQGRIPSARIGNRRVIPVDGLKVFLASCEVKP